MLVTIGGLGLRVSEVLAARGGYRQRRELETAKLVGVEPAAYLGQAATAARRGDMLLPHELLD